MKLQVPFWYLSNMNHASFCFNLIYLCILKDSLSNYKDAKYQLAYIHKQK
jgi:hypothetical protein